MQIQTQTQPIESNLPLENVTNFTLEANTKAFDILSSNLYQDKPEAIVRELSCNAYDAHVANSNPEEPFEITLPSSMNPSFCIRDFGTGLSHEDMVGLYTTYFGSNKRDTNSLIGGLGLGSKTPFAYCDAFAVTSYFNGYARQYSVFKDEDGCPAITLVSESKTEQRNGLEIIIPIKETDFYIFKDKAEKVLKWFPIKPKGVNVPKLEWELKAEKYGLLKGSHRWHSLDQAKLLMGNVLYNIKGEALNLDNREKGQMEVVLRNTGMVVFAEIGDVDIAASREALSYDKRSIAKLKDLIKAIADEIMADATAKVKSKATMYEQMKEITFMVDQLGLSNEGRKVLVEDMGLWNGTLLHASNVHSTRWSLKTLKKDHGALSLNGVHARNSKDPMFLYCPEPLQKYTKWLRHNEHMFEGRTLWFLTGDWYEFEDLFHGIYPWDFLVHVDELEEPPTERKVTTNTSSGGTRVSKPVSLYKRNDININRNDFLDQKDVSKQMMSYSSPMLSDELDEDISYLLVESNGAKNPWGDKAEHLHSLWEKANRPQNGRAQILYIPKSVGKRVREDLFSKYETYESFLHKRIEQFKKDKEVHSDMYSLFSQMSENKRMWALILEWRGNNYDRGLNDPVHNLLLTWKYVNNYVAEHNLNESHNSEKDYTTQIDTMMGDVYDKYPWLLTCVKEGKVYWRNDKMIDWEVFEAIRRHCDSGTN